MKNKAVEMNNNCFDIIRIICALMVFFGHFLTHFSVENEFLHGIAYFIRGVPVFFFLSGLFIARSHEKYTAKSFFVKRAIRIYPELWICVVLNLVIILICYGLGTSGKPKDILIYLGSQMTFFQFYTGEWLRGYGVGTPNGALWTITVDIQFYIISVLLAKWLKNRQIKTWGIVIILAMVLDLVIEKTKGYYPDLLYKLFECNIISFVWIFLLGMFVYYYRDKVIPLLTKKYWIFFILYVIWQYLVPSQVLQLVEGVRYNIITTAIMLLVITSIGFSFTKRLRHDYSYSFYLYHMVAINFVINNIKKSFASTGEMIGFLVAISIATASAAFFSHYFIAGKLTRTLEKRIF